MTTTTTTPQVPVVRMPEELTIQNAAVTKASLMVVLLHAPAVDIDLADVVELDTAGLQVLLLARSEALSHGVVLRLLNRTEAVSSSLALVGLAAALGSSEVAA